MTSLPKTYKAVVQKSATDTWELSDVPLQHPKANQVLVKVLDCGVCFSDVMIGTGEMGNIFPRVLGHEIVGDIVEVGPGVTTFQQGQRVGGAWHGGHDGICRQCQRSIFQLCDNAAINGVTQDGGFAEYVILRTEAVVRIPKELDPAKTAPLLCAGVTVFNGLGGLGHLAVQYANKMGYEVVAISTGDDKAAFAKQLGAHHYINSKKTNVSEELMKLGGAAIVVQTAPDPAVYGALMKGLAVEGKLLNLAVGAPFEVEPAVINMRAAAVQGWPSGHALDSEEAIRFALLHGVECMVETYPLAETQKAIQSLVSGKPRFSNVLVMQ
ncbi:alcohol dehydrogenase groES-like domain-containing protein [Trichoderma breve]|uniref:Alcohol dehydrogenase groES-like domain-containing protein n=1 Tax=Trichoderma breve TaxID=2034170 RepID=A0A9W9JTB9_9HYPO|nr:alcohol dehydrogenase groES-like domain-containing protein [Trichoderma breve]KAJ4865607.1 alcohol dehydrogenase groES-like domain-containing protein [Trichoderma breve]